MAEKTFKTHWQLNSDSWVFSARGIKVYVTLTLIEARQMFTVWSEDGGYVKHFWSEQRAFKAAERLVAGR
jgi:hypothetical protein